MRDNMWKLYDASCITIYYLYTHQEINDTSNQRQTAEGMNVKLYTHRVGYDAKSIDDDIAQHMFAFTENKY